MSISREKLEKYLKGLPIQQKELQLKVDQLEGAIQLLRQLISDIDEEEHEPGSGINIGPPAGDDPQESLSDIPDSGRERIKNPDGAADS